MYMCIYLHITKYTFNFELTPNISNTSLVCNDPLGKSTGYKLLYNGFEANCKPNN